MLCLIAVASKLSFCFELFSPNTSFRSECHLYVKHPCPCTFAQMKSIDFKAAESTTIILQSSRPGAGDRAVTESAAGTRLGVPASCPMPYEETRSKAQATGSVSAACR